MVSLGGRIVRILIATVLTVGLVPAVAFADQSTVDTHQEQMESSLPTSGKEGVHDKADYYQEAELLSELAYNADSEAVLKTDSAEDSQSLSPNTVRASSLTPVYLSSEFKYFNKYESGGNYDQGFSYGDDYHALGAYQFDHRYVLKSFISDCYHYDPNTFSMFAQFLSISDADFKKSDAIRSNGKFTDLGNALNKAWHDAYKTNPSLFAALQDSWAYNNYYVTIESYLAGRGIDISNRADCVKGLCWGLTSLFGTGGVRLFVGGYASAYNWDGKYVTQEWPGCGLRNDMSDIEFVTALCTYVADNVSVFYAAQPQYHAGWSNRYRNELNDCLNYLGTWEQVGNRWKYKQRSGYVANRWLKIKSVWYWFDSEGYAAQSELKVISGVKYYFDADCGMSESTWEKISGSWYYFDSSGAMRTGWLNLNNKWRHLGANGAMVTGWLLDDDMWYYLDPLNDGIMYTGWLNLDGRQRYLKSNGAMATGWIFDNNKWFYFNPVNDGIMATGWLYLNGKWRYLDDDGAMRTGWLYDADKWYYLNPSNDGIMYTGWLSLGGKWRYMTSSGAMITGWLWDNAWYYLDPANDGIMVTGWFKDSEDWYYLKASGVMACNMWIGNYYLLADGKMATSQWIENYYVGSDGKWISGYEDSQLEIVYVATSGSGTKYHSVSNCSGMNSARQLSLSEATNRGYTACSKCF